MKKNTITQFVCFVTDLEFEEFIVSWDQYASQFIDDPESVVLQQAGGKSRFKYISQHECAEKDFKFTFMKGRNSEHLPEKKAKVILAGGYTPMQIGCRNHNKNVDIKIVAFIGHNENDIDFYKHLSYKYLNIYQAYYESCSHAYIMEFFVQEKDVAELLLQLKSRTGVEASVYQECLVPHL